MPKQEVTQEADASAMVPSASPRVQPQIDTQMGSTLFVFAGVAAGALAALWVAVPKLLPAQAPLLEHATSRGVTAGLLAGVATVMFALGVLTRRLGRNLDALSQVDDHNPVIDQIVMDLSQTRTSMQELRVEYVYLKEHVTSMGRDLPAQIAEASESATRDAMYRLAASLDQVGARLEQRIRSQHSTLEGVLQEVQQSLQATCEQVTQMQQALAQPIAAPAGWEMPGEAQPEAKAPISLGVLDHLADDQSIPSPSGHEFPPLLPSEQASYEEKISQLAQLLADPRVRAAADGITRSRGL